MFDGFLVPDRRRGAGRAPTIVITVTGAQRRASPPADLPLLADDVDPGERRALPDRDRRGRPARRPRATRAIVARDEG
jgi:hypothetical protein